ncbi:TetR/AcrR family transcriptional regulator [Marinospirillum alkaliphilum]|uniref:Transcriptional regulator, TetR family n=1 Tax=Marinospirillum alkaliphilum DSM 21637 TaxID=1122209 RepID=A0A1K1YZA7_9GAMM|nr:TetR/AcrR family transcriptional regulator [Marinospirillum alkaliphilum]SFX67254.1 transcriptional regulator, TetR family [Marinospirillum alkaliphilum DSM 21637]
MNLNKNSKRRKELVAIAARLFCDQGYESTTVRMLADAMGIKSGSLFHHFSDKQEILYAVIESGMLHAMEIARQTLASARTSKEKLHALARAHLSTLLEDRDAHVVAIYEWRSLTQESRDLLVELRDAYETSWREVISECHEAGLIKGDQGLQRRLALGALNWTVQWYHPDGELTPDDLAQELVAMVLREPSAV